MKIGFTGTREGMSHNQMAVFIRVIEKLSPTEFHHGDCIGADAEAHDLVSCEKHIHPPDENYARAYKQGKIYIEKPYLTRNKDIVDSTEILIAIPKTNKEEQRSGTWSTVRYARKKNKAIIIINPDGSIIKEVAK